MTAKLVISFDFELGWGVLDGPLWRQREADGLYRRMRPVLAELFAFLHEHELPTTWATVSSMTLEEEDQLPLDHLPADYREAVLAFFRAAEPETRSALDLLEAWQAQVGAFSELCSHTATHPHARMPGLEPAQLVEDVSLSLTRLEEFSGRPVESLIFARDQAECLEEVAARHPLNFRVGPTTYGRPGSGRLSRIWRGARRYLDPLPEGEVAAGPHGSCIQRGSFYFNWSGGDFEALKRRQVQIQASRLVRQMNGGGGTYHVWLHPFNLAESNRHWPAFRGFLEACLRLRDREALAILTMKERGEATH
jgi:peptidoglycan/xylan/chitin deacetylase (PgdA/CDA1 family)